MPKCYWAVHSLCRIFRRRSKHSVVARLPLPLPIYFPYHTATEEGWLIQEAKFLDYRRNPSLSTQLIVHCVHVCVNAALGKWKDERKPFFEYSRNTFYNSNVSQYYAFSNSILEIFISIFPSQPWCSQWKLTAAEKVTSKNVLMPQLFSTCTKNYTTSLAIETERERNREKIGFVPFSDTCRLHEFQSTF